MDPITAFSLAAAIAQFVDLGIKVTKRMNEFSAAASEEGAPKAFRDIQQRLPVIVNGLGRLSSHGSTGEVDAQTVAVLRPVVAGCLAETQDLDGILNKAMPSAGASSWERRAKALASFKYDKKIDKIAENLNTYLLTLTFHQVIDMSQRLTINEALPPKYEEQEHKEKDKERYWLVPYDINSSFVGRASVLEEIDEKFAVEAGVQPKAALYGLGGIGKSQVALEYCHRRRKKDTSCSVFWCNAATSARFEESLNRLAAGVGLTSKEDASSGAGAFLKSYLEFRHPDPWLMVIDNVDDENVFFKQRLRDGQTPAECIPRSANGCLLFTSRSRDIAIDAANPAEPILVSAMTRVDGLELARKRLPRDTSEELMLELLEVLEYIPLAMTQACAFIAKRRKSVRQYLELYRKNDAAKTRLLDFEFLDHGRQGSSLDSVAKTWVLSFEAIRESNPRAAELLCLITFFQHQGVPAVLLRGEGEDDFDFQDAAALLKAFSFVEADEDDTMFNTHQLVQLATKWWLDRATPSEVEMWAAAALEAVSRQFPGPYVAFDAEYFTLCAILQPHAELMLQHEFKERKNNAEVELARARLLIGTGRYLIWVGDAHEGCTRFQESVEIRSRLLGERHVDTMESTAVYGWLLAIGMKDRESISILERLYHLRTEILGEDDRRTIDTLSDYATAVEIDDIARSEVMQREALARSERVLGRHHNDTLNCMEHLAMLLEETTKIPEAVALQREVHQVKLQARGPRNMEVLVAENNLALLLSYDDDTFEEGIAMIRRNFETKMEVCGCDHAETLITAVNMALWLSEKDRLDEAKEVYARTLQLSEDGPRKHLPTTHKWRGYMEQRLQYLESCEEIE